MNRYENTEISALILAVRERDEEAFSEIVRRYTPMMRKVVASFQGQSDDFGEYFSEACVALHSAALNYDFGRSSVTFGLYARICVHHRLVDLLRARGAGWQFDECDVDTVPSVESIESDIVERETVELLMKGARALLSDYEYRVLLLHMQGYKTAEIARVVGKGAKSVDNAKSRLFRRLREQFGGTVESSD